jgi:phage head maturation protease
MNLISTAEFHRNAKAGGKPRGPVFRISMDPVEDVAGKPRTKRFCFSDGTVDRMGSTINVNGWDLSDFERNPVALWAHSSSDPPIGRASNVGVVGRRLMGDIEFASAEVYPFADTIFRLVDGGFIRAVSVGFIPTKYSFVDNDPDRGFGIDFLEQILAEISACPVPANPNALGEARAKGIDTRPISRWAERALDSRRPSIINRNSLARLRADAKEPPRPRNRAADLCRAAAIRARYDAKLLPVHRYEPTPTPTEAERIEADRERRAAGYAAAQAALAWW